MFDFLNKIMSILKKTKQNVLYYGKSNVRYSYCIYHSIIFQIYLWRIKKQKQKTNKTTGHRHPICTQIKRKGESESALLCP